MRKITLIISVLVFSFGLYTKAFALTVSPAKVEVRVDPGQTAHGEIELFNEQENSKTFYTSYENFESMGDSGAPYFVGANGGLATWLSSEKEVYMAHGERRKIPYSIEVPKNAAPGGYFAAIFFGTEKPKEGAGGEVAIGGKIGVLILLRVNGEVKESAGLSNFRTKNNERFFVNTPIDFEYSLNNTGGDRVVPKGEVVIRNTFRSKIASLLANDKEGSVLPGSTRRFEVKFGEDKKDASIGFFATAKSQLNNFHFGLYSASLDIVWGETSQSGRDTYYFFMFPWQLLSIIFVIILVLRVVLSIYKKSVIASVSNSGRK